MNGKGLTLSHIQMHFDASAADNFWKHFGTGEVAHDEQFHHLQQCFQLHLMIKVSLLEIFHIFDMKFSKSAGLVMIWQDLRVNTRKLHNYKTAIGEPRLSPPLKIMTNTRPSKKTLLFPTHNTFAVEDFEKHIGKHMENLY